jgi:hypothetical protein
MIQMMRRVESKRPCATSTFTLRMAPHEKHIYKLISHFILCRANRGTAIHDNKHRCKSTKLLKQFGCPSEPKSCAWTTTDEEYIKFGSRLINQRVGVKREQILERYMSSWKVLHPDEEVPLTLSGEPIDFLWESIHPCHHIPWMKDIPESNSLTGKFSTQFY